VYRNSEIYNHEDIKAKELHDAPFTSTSDSEVLGHWYAKNGEITNEMLDKFDGIFATILVDENTGHFIAARDAMGICPLYWGWGKDGSTWFASEMKALQDVCENFEIFPPVCERSA
jgi:asparagine synthase (glutamine-hydrolysing)